MGQIFHPSANTIAKVSIFGAIFIIAAVAWTISEINRSPYITQVNVAREQPIPFSHKHHVDGLGIDCRFCHTSVEDSSFAGIPSTSTCMKCHSVMWADSPMIRPIHESFKENKPIEWVRVHDLPDHVYFDHSIHVAKGVACVSCHGQVDQMPLTWRVNTLHMQWCLDCHRHPETKLRPKDEVFNRSWEKPKDLNTLQSKLAKEYKVRKPLNCSACHR